MKIVNSVNELISVLESDFGFKKGDKIQIASSQIDRKYDLEINFIPHDENELKALIESAPKDILKKMGVDVWESYDGAKKAKESTYLQPGEYHYLFPGEWYDYIPEGFEVINISGETERFKRGETDDDKRYGCLAYGFIRKF